MKKDSANKAKASELTVGSFETTELNDQELHLLETLENTWKPRLERFHVPQPNAEQSRALALRISQELQLEQAGAQERIVHVQPVEQVKQVLQDIHPVDHWLELEQSRQKQSLLSRTVDLLRSQWNVYGLRSWIATGAMILISGWVSGLSDYSAEKTLQLWLYWMSLIGIGIIIYAFRPRSEGMSILQNLGRYTLMQQVLARLLLVLLLESTAAIPTAFLIHGHNPGYSLYMFLFGWMAPMLFMTVLGFVLTQWLGSWMAFFGCITVWALQLLSNGRLDWAYLFISPASTHYWTAQNTMLLVSLSMLLSYYFIQKKIHQKGAKGELLL